MAKKKKEEPKVETKVSEEVTCPVCGKPVGIDVASCPFCGAEFETEGGVVEDEGEMAECPVCGRMSSVNAASCPHCGAEFEEEAEEVEGEPLESPRATPEKARAEVPARVAAPVSQEETAECPVCGKLVSLEVSSCPFCGAEFEEEEVEEIIEVEEKPLPARAPARARPAPVPAVEVRGVEEEEVPSSHGIMDPQVIGIALIALGILGSQIAFMIDWYWTWVPPIEENLGMFVAIPAVVIAAAILVYSMMKRSASEGKKVPRNIPGYMMSMFLFGVFALIMVMLWNPINSALQDSNTTIGVVFVVLLIVGLAMVVLRSRISARAAA